MVVTTRAAGRHTDIVVSLVIGAVLLYVGWLILPTPLLAWAAVSLLLYEGWTLVNKYADDTISAAVARLTARQPLVAWLFGNGNLYVLGFVVLPSIMEAARRDDTRAVFGQIVLVAVIEVLQGHFFFSMGQVAAVAEEKRVEVAAETGIVPPKNGGGSVGAP